MCCSFGISQCFRMFVQTLKCWYEMTLVCQTNWRLLRMFNVRICSKMMPETWHTLWKHFSYHWGHGEINQPNYSPEFLSFTYKWLAHVAACLPPHFLSRWRKLCKKNLLELQIFKQRRVPSMNYACRITRLIVRHYACKITEFKKHRWDFSA